MMDWITSPFWRCLSCYQATYLTMTRIDWSYHNVMSMWNARCTIRLISLITLSSGYKIRELYWFQLYDNMLKSLLSCCRSPGITSAPLMGCSRLYRNVSYLKQWYIKTGEEHDEMYAFICEMCLSLDEDIGISCDTRLCWHQYIGYAHVASSLLPLCSPWSMDVHLHHDIMMKPHSLPVIEVTSYASPQATVAR